MKKLSHQMIIFGIILAVLAVLFATVIGAEATTYHQGEEFLPPSPDQDPCLHCHIAGSETNPSTPINRWIAFGATGLIFLFGITRNISVWRNPEEWQHRWRSKLGRFIPYIFLLQAITGIILLFFAKPMPEALLDTPVSFDFVIRAIQANYRSPICVQTGLSPYLQTTCISFTFYSSLP
ncbi:MAG: hypothetical protein B5M51_02490 [Anaerolinea sp. 4484_236]|nr:MAG: hypothetical protein B5M51_02490 [Anaerolinea sp. 4484_236]